MSETDDIYDLDDFLLKDRHVRVHIKRAWKRHLRYVNDCEREVERSRDITEPLARLRDALLKR